MRLLLDESVPAKLRRHLPEHEVCTAVEMGWAGARNGRLLALASSQFDAFITVDKNLQFQQNLVTLPVAVLVLDASSNELDVLLQLLPELRRELGALRPKTLCVVRGGA
jgi:predicted nuclease of predicted toxin-antitoxin system